MQRPFVFYPALIFFVGAFFYFNSLTNGFTFDDKAIVVANPVVHSLDLAEIFSAPWWPGQKKIGLYRPLTTLTYALNYRLHGLLPFAYHLGNLVLHLLNGTLLFWILYRLLGEPAAAGVAALVFVLHPVQTEAVNGVVGRAELLAAFFVLMAWVFYLGASYAQGSMQRRWYGVSLCTALVACFAKEHAVLLVGILALYDFLLLLRKKVANPFRYFLRFDVPRYIPYLLVVGLYLIIRYQVIGAVLLPTRPTMVDNPLAYLPTWQRMLTAVGVIARYAGLLLVPYSLSADYSYNQIPAVTSVLDLWLLVGLLVVAGMGLVVVQSVRGRISPDWGFGTAFLMLTLLPVCNLLFAIGTPMGERLLYLPLVGFCFLLGVGYRKLSRRLTSVWFLPAVSVVLLGIYGGRTYVRNADWMDDYSLFSSAVEAAPQSAKAHFNLGNIYRNQKVYNEAFGAYQNALEIYPGYAEVYYNVGVIYQDQGRIDQAVRAYSEALIADSLHVNAWVNIGTLLGRKKQYQSAVKAFERARALDPDNLSILFNFALACQELGRNEEAAGAYLKILEARPAHVDAAINLGSLYADIGYVGETISVYKKLLNEKPDAYRIAYNLAVLEERMGKVEAAAAAYAQAAGSTEEMGAFAQFKAGTLYQEMGRSEDAIRALNGFLERWQGDPRFRLKAQQLLRELELQNR